MAQYILFTIDTLKNMKIDRKKEKEWKNRYHGNVNQEKADVATLYRTK